MSKQAKKDKPLDEEVKPLRVEVNLSIYGIPNMTAETIEEVAKWLEGQACCLRMNRQEDYSKTFKARFLR